MGHLFLTIKNGRLVALLDNDVEIVVRDLSHVNELLAKHNGATCSSTVDFPHEYTNNADVIALCQKLRAE